MLAVGAQQQQPVGLAWLLPALGTAASASCQFVCPQWGSALSTQAQPAFFGQDFLQLQPQVHGPGAPLPSRVLPNPGWLAGLPPLFAPPTQEQPGRTPPGDSIQQSHCERDSVDASFHLVTSDQSQQTGKLSPVAPTRRLLAYEDRAWSTESCDSLSEDSQGDLSDQEDLSESNLSSQGSQQTSSSALEVCRRHFLFSMHLAAHGTSMKQGSPGACAARFVHQCVWLRPGTNLVDNAYWSKRALGALLRPSHWPVWFRIICWFPLLRDVGQVPAASCDARPMSCAVSRHSCADTLLDISM